MAQSDPIESYNSLMSKYKDLTILLSAESVIQWDMETKMPPGAINLRSEQLALLSTIDHKMSTDPEMGVLLGKVIDHAAYADFSEVQKRNIYLIKKNYDEKTKLPDKLVAEMAKQQVIAYNTWKKAKAAKDFSIFRPELTRMFDLKMESADILKGVKGSKTYYDAMIDLFESKMDEDTIAKTFNTLKSGLKPIIEKCVSSKRQPDMSIVSHRVPVDIQEKLSKSLVKYIGYDISSDEAKGRIDETEHPFTNGYYDDVRITTHYKEDEFTSSLFSVLHEGGHALYEQNLKREWMYQPVGSACSYGFHESQSRFVENVVGRSREFWEYYLPELKRITSSALPGIELEPLLRAVNAVRPSKIRVEADEVTYSMHIIIRFELERELFAGKLSIDELPQVWNQKYMDYLGMDIQDDTEGVMQDVHWAQGYFGYFPSYALGNIYGGQIVNRMQKDLPDWRARIAEGKFSEILQWLINNLHEKSCLYDPIDMLIKVTGEGINSKYFIDYLDRKYSEIYGY